MISSHYFCVAFLICTFVPCLLITFTICCMCVCHVLIKEFTYLLTYLTVSYRLFIICFGRRYCLITGKEENVSPNCRQRRTLIVSPLSAIITLSTCWDRNAGCCVNITDGKITIAKNYLVNFGQGTLLLAPQNLLPWQRPLTRRDGDKLAYPDFIICAGIIKHMGICQR